LVPATTSQKGEYDFIGIRALRRDAPIIHHPFFFSP
jgi:hypothetical protein